MESLWKEHSEYAEGYTVGHVDRPQRLHRVQRLRHRLPEREQHPDRRASEQVRNGREMHWIRVDRYFKWLPGADPQVVFQADALHALRERSLRAGLPGGRHGARLEQGLNTDGLQPLHRDAILLQQLSLQGAPVQLLQLHQGHSGDRAAGQQSRRHGPLARRDGEVHVLHPANLRSPRSTPSSRTAGLERRRTVQTACQQACPSQAIAFGNISDPDSVASHGCQERQDRNYALLGELHNKPRTTFLAKLRNPHPGAGCGLDVGGVKAPTTTSRQATEGLLCGRCSACWPCPCPPPVRARAASSSRPPIHPTPTWITRRSTSRRKRATFFYDGSGDAHSRSREPSRVAS